MESPTKSFSKQLSKVWEAKKKKKKKSYVRTKILTNSEVPEPKGRKEQIILWWICSHIISFCFFNFFWDIFSFVLCSLLLWPTINLFLFSEAIGIAWALFSGLIQLTIGCVNWAALLGCFVHLSMSLSVQWQRIYMHTLKFNIALRFQESTAKIYPWVCLSLCSGIPTYSTIITVG